MVGDSGAESAWAGSPGPVERSSRTVAEVAEAWLERGRRPLGETKLCDVTPDRVAAWSQGNEQALASAVGLARAADHEILEVARRCQGRPL